MSSLSLTVPDFPSSIAWECGLLFEVRKREKLVIAVPFFALLMLSDFTFLFCQGRPRNVRSCKTHKLSHCSIHEFFYFATLSLLSPSLNHVSLQVMSTDVSFDSLFISRSVDRPIVGQQTYRLLIDTKSIYRVAGRL